MWSTHVRINGGARLTDANALIVDGDGLRCFRYWALDPTRTLTLGSDAEYVERVRAVFREAVAARLRTDWPVGAVESALATFEDV